MAGRLVTLWAEVSTIPLLLPCAVGLFDDPERLRPIQQTLQTCTRHYHIRDFLKTKLSAQLVPILPLLKCEGTLEIQATRWARLKSGKIALSAAYRADQQRVHV